jgi:peptidyl-prolyl cis-trans isomerase A (cyclophilin A)
MLRRSLLALSAALVMAQTAAAAQAPAAQAPPEPPAAAPAPKPLPLVKLETAAGDIVIELATEKAPITAGNFLKYVSRGLFNGTTFYRASRPPGYTATDYGSIQGGLQNDPAKVLPPIAHEPTTRTGLKHVDGVISMGRHAPGSAQADFFICVGEMSYLDADPKDPRKTPGFAAFGRVVQGMDVVRTILGMPVDPNRGEGAMKGEMLVKPVRILKATRLAAPAS